MKKTLSDQMEVVRPKLLTALFALSFFVLSCQKEEQKELVSETAKEATLDDPVAYTEQNLKVLGKAAVSLASDPDFRSALYSEIEKQFDGEYNVLFETLTDRATSDKSNFGKRMSASARTEDAFFKAQRAFKGIEGEDFFPQIYIPFYDELKEKKKSNARILSVESDPVIVIFTGDEAQEVFPGYRLNEEGELEETGFLVDENYAQNNEVWVISINERFFGNEEWSKTEEANNQRTMLSRSAIINKMTLKCHFESWAAGASEVRLIGVFSNWGFSEVDQRDYGQGPYEGGEIFKFSRKAVKNEWEKDVNFYILNDWDDRAPEMPYVNYAIHEYDSYPTGKRDVTWYHNNAKFTGQYRSAEKYYDMNTVYKTDFNGYYIDNTCIRWSAIYQ